MPKTKRPWGKRNAPQGRAAPRRGGWDFPSEPSPRKPPRTSTQHNQYNSVKKTISGAEPNATAALESGRRLGKMTEDQVSSGEFADLRPNPKVYLDSNIVSAIAKDDIPTESEALNRLLQAWDDKKVDLVTSEVTLWEFSAHQDELKRRLVERTYRRLAKAQIIRWYELAGMHSYGDRHTWISTPIIQNDPVYAALLALGLEFVDAQHVFVAVSGSATFFLPATVVFVIGLLPSKTNLN